MALTAANLNRRAVLGGGALLLPNRAFAAPASPDVAGLEKRLGSRIGLAALDIRTGKMLRHRADERFLMCSTFKLALAAAILRRVERSEEQSSRLVRYTQAELLPYSPVTTANVTAGLTIEALCAAIIHISDNAAANLLLRSMGGPMAVTAFLREIGDTTTRLDRMESDLNIRDGDKDTTTPAAMLTTMHKLLLGPVLQPGSREKLIGWMEEVTTGGTLLRAGLSSRWRVGDKTGRGAAGEINDLAIIRREEGRSPVLVCAYTEHADDRTLADIGRVIAGAFA